MTAKLAGTRVIHAGWARLLVADVDFGDGVVVPREIEDHGRAVGVLPYDPEQGMALLVRQARAPVLYAGGGMEPLLEVPAGLLEESDPEAAARREAEEEVGLRLSALDHVVTAWSMPGVSTERIDLYLGAFRSADRVGEGGGLAAEHERITVIEIPLSDLATLADRGGLTDLKTLVLVQALRLRRPELFPPG